VPAVRGCRRAFRSDSATVAGRPQKHVGPGHLTGPYVVELRVLPSLNSGKRSQAFGENPVVVGSW
jgi:hypothetical protein